MLLPGACRELLDELPDSCTGSLRLEYEACTICSTAPAAATALVTLAAAPSPCTPDAGTGTCVSSCAGSRASDIWAGSIAGCSAGAA